MRSPELLVFRLTPTAGPRHPGADGGASALRIVQLTFGGGADIAAMLYVDISVAAARRSYSDVNVRGHGEAEGPGARYEARVRVARPAAP